MTGKKLVAACLAVAFLTVMLPGCFVSEEKFNAQTDELKVTKGALAKAQGDQGKTAADLATATQAAAKLQTDLTAAKTACKKAQDACGLAEGKVKTLQTENASLKTQADQASKAKGEAAKLQKDLTASKAAAKKSGDACKAAEAQAKSLKGEVVKLKKQIADLEAQVKTLSEKPAKTPPATQ